MPLSHFPFAAPHGADDLHRGWGSLLEKLLATVPLFAGMGQGDLRAFLAHCKPLQVTAGSAVVVQGESGRHLFIVLSGTLLVAVCDAEGQSRSLATLVAGDCFGELALLDYGPHSATVTANEDCRLLAFDRSDIVKIEPHMTTLYRNLGRQMSQRLRRTLDMVTLRPPPPQEEEAAMLHARKKRYYKRG